MGLWVVSKTRLDVTRLKFLLESTLSKRLIEDALEVEDNGKMRLENILDSYSDNGRNLAGRLRFYPIYKVLDILRRSFDRTKEEFQGELKNPTIRKILLNSLQSLKKYGLSRPQVFAAPMMVVWNYTNRCNLRCNHCYQDAGPARNERRTAELTTEERLRVLDELAESNIPTVFFSGGEPLMEPDFWQVAQYAREKGFYFSIATNGTLFNKENARRAAELTPGYVAASLDAATPEVHDQIRGVQGMWKRTVEGIRNLIEAGVITCISYTQTRQNADEFPKMFELRQELGAYKVIMYNYIPVGRADFENDPTPEQREEAYRVMYGHLEAGRHVVATTAPQFGSYCKQHSSSGIILAHYADLKAKELGVIADIISGCGAGRAYCSIQPDGKVTPCVYMPDLVVGDLRKQPFKQIWEESPVMVSLRDRNGLWGSCSTCQHNAICGGCRARAYAYFNDLKAPDPGCINNSSYYYQFVENGKKVARGSKRRFDPETLTGTQREVCELTPEPSSSRAS